MNSRGTDPGRQKRFQEVLIPGFCEAPGAKIKVLSIDAELGQPIAPNSNFGEVELLSGAKSTGSNTAISSDEYGVIKEIYLNVGDIVQTGQPIGLIELYDKSEFIGRSDEYEAARASNRDIVLVKYPQNLKGDSPEILRRAAKLMQGIYRYWNSDEVSSPAEECVYSPLGASLLEETTCEPDDLFPDEFWGVSRQIFFEGENTNGIDAWFEEDQLRFDFLEQRFANARYEPTSSEEVFRYPNLLRWVYDNERAISTDSDLGDQRVREIYEVIELDRGSETRADNVSGQQN